ncbi:MAG: hypothetical protein ACI87E_001713 [Mariniblastus sp.]|jgi:hypothetical protein
MTNRILRLMLVFALLANQATICAAHSHHDSEPSDHSARSHVHLSGHSHDGGSHAHHDSGEHQHPDEPQPSDDSESGLDSSNLGDHDSDAFYFGDQDNIHNQSNRLIAKDLNSIAVLFIAQQSLVLPPAIPSQRTRAGPFLASRLAIYLQTSRLLL